MYGILYICGTPIGNIQDITLRQLETLKAADVILCEDTRNTLKLLNHYEIKNKLISYHEHNAREKGGAVIAMLKEGKNIALVSDAGMPGISDPGEDIIRLCKAEGIKVTTVPGPTAVITGLILSGMAVSKYSYYGFFPRDKKEQKAVLERIKNDYMTSVFYEAPHRILKTLNILKEYLGEDRKVAFARELTKKYEESLSCTIGEMIKHFEKTEPKGEFVLIISGISLAELKEAQIEEFEKITVSDHVTMYENKGYERKEAMKLAAKDRGISKREIYNALMKKDSSTNADDRNFF